MLIFKMSFLRMNDLQDQLKALEQGLAAMDGSDTQHIAVSFGFVSVILGLKYNVGQLLVQC